jgi:ABC-2 type transport system ATP-binding protein
MGSPATTPVLCAEGLCKSFGGKPAVAGVDLAVWPGEVVGFLGPNGAGKTTVMTMITGLSVPDAGRLALFGVEGGAARPDLRCRIGFLQEQPRVYPEMSGRAYLRLFASLYGVADPRRRVEALIDRMSLAHAADRPLSTYSRGMQQRTCLARVLLHEPDFLVLDEPTLGLDPAGVDEVRDIVLELNRAGVAILFSSHQLAEMERICDRIVLMNEGRVVAAGTKDDLARRLLGCLQVEIELAAMRDGVERALLALPFVAGVVPAGERRLRADLSGVEERDMLAARAALSAAAAGAGATVLAVSARTLTLEETFLRVTRETAH